MRNLVILACIFFATSVFAQTPPTTYSWETQQAKVLPNGDLQWAPLPFQLVKGASVRYIDFENGNDSNDGLTTATAWKRHPWDPQATGIAKSTFGIHTYIFKRGVVYRGVLVAKHSGTFGDPVRLTSDPEWGTGEAAIYGSVQVTNGWQKADATIAPNIPNPELVWYRSISGIDNPTKVVGEVTSEGIKRIYLARTPNYVNTPAEPMQKWWMFTAKTKVGSTLQLTDTKNFTWKDVNALKGGDVWAIEDAVVMSTLWKQKISDYNPTTKTITVPDQNFGGKDCKYYVENTPYMLDAPGEYYYDRPNGRLFIRLEGDKDPNTTTIEVASKATLLTLSNVSNVEISGLTIGFTTYDNVRYGQADGMPTIKVENASGITIKNCKFQFLNGAVMTTGTGKNLVITDNEMNYMDDFSILLNGTDEISILRNKIFENGTRHLGRWYSSIPAISGTISVGEIAGNIIEHTWGSGINMFWGKGDKSTSTIPFIRGLVHHNRVSHSLQGVNDYGGIESWQGGPVYTYNNVSEDAQGWHYNWGTQVVSIGYPFYFDGAFKQYAFNNIVKGTGWNKTSAAYMQVLGFYNMYVHNIAYNVGSLTGSGDGNLAPDGQNYYLANVGDSTKLGFDHTTRVSGIPFESFYNNFFSGKIFEGTFVTNSPRFKLTFGQFVDKLNSYTPDLGQVGFEASKRVFARSKTGDFRPTATSELIDRGVKFFAPFPLSRVVGEWHFLKHRADSSLIKGENFYFTSEFTDREKFNNVPKNHLKAYGLSSGSFVKGNLEDFAEGALVFDGQTTWCGLKNTETSKTTCNNVDMPTSFILEAYFKTTPQHTGGVLISKWAATGYGYQLDIHTTGNARMSIMNNGNAVFSQLGAVVNDGNWHHVLAEVNRATSSVKIYIDGILSNTTATGTMPSSGVTFTNAADFVIGKNSDGNFFAGTLDFVRVSKGTLYDALTTIDELYKWQFNGPFLRDFAGNVPVGQRDAGALEKGAKLCNMSTSSSELFFGLGGGTKSFTIEAEKGFEMTKKVGSFYTATVTGNTVNVTVSALASGTRSGDIYIYGCNETKKVKVTQQHITAINAIGQPDIKVMPNPVSGLPLSISIPEGLTSGRAVFMDLNGRVLLENMVFSGTNSIPVNLPRGLYLLSISGEEVNYTTKIVVN
jgi:hypothetical protein